MIDPHRARESELQGNAMDCETFGETEIRVRYAETDQMGILHHANYLVYFELGRVELLRSRGLNYKDIEAQGFFLVIANARIRYRRPARYDDLLLLRTGVLRATGARIDHQYELWRGNELIADGETTLACVDRDGQLQRIPEMLRRRE
jgi:acyl-CoA thioester hydrolase